MGVSTIGYPKVRNILLDIRATGASVLTDLENMSSELKLTYYTSAASDRPPVTGGGFALMMSNTSPNYKRVIWFSASTNVIYTNGIDGSTGNPFGWTQVL